MMYRATLRVMTLLLILVMTSCSHVAEFTQRRTRREAFSLERRIGWFNGACLALYDTNVAGGEIVTLVLMGEPQTTFNAKIGEKVSSSASCPPLTEGRSMQNSRSGAFFYALRETSVTATDMGIGIVRPPHKVTIVNGFAQTDLESDGQHEVFSSCATTEGINFAVWKRRAFSGTPLWSKYYYLGYDLKPTCP